MTIALGAAGLALALSCSRTPKECELQVITTGDVHGAWFDKPYVEGQALKTSLMSVKAYVDSVRAAAGEDNVLLLDAGDILQGDNAPYYYNYVDIEGEHLYPKIAKYMGYDAAVVGNHDIETGHDVYDKVDRELNAAGIPWLGGNAINTVTGKPYFPVYRMYRRAGMRVAVLGFTNPNMSAWLDESLWTGIDFRSLLPLVQENVDKVVRKERPDAVIVVVHSGTGNGDGQILESQGLDLLNTLHGVDLLVTSHDHRPTVMSKDGMFLINGGARAGNVGRATIKLTKTGREVSGKVVEGWTDRLDKTKVDEAMEAEFTEGFEKVKAFTLKPVGTLAMDLRTTDAYRGMNDYMNLVHTVQLGVEGAQLSFAAPLTANGVVKAGQLIYNDMFTIYPYENQLFVVKLTGAEVKKYLEYSYANWIVTSDTQVLNIRAMDDPRSGFHRWSFVERSYNFDSCAGLNYTVDITKPAGSRIEISTLADGTPFDPEAWYNVAMTSYRASGGGDLIIKGAGVSKEGIDERIVSKHPEIREMIYRYIKDHDSVTSELIGDPALLGTWKFVPETKASALMDKDYERMFK